MASDILVNTGSWYVTNGDILSVVLLEISFSELSVKTTKFSLKKTHLRMLSAKWWPFCSGLNVLMSKISWQLVGLDWISLMMIHVLQDMTVSWVALTKITAWISNHIHCCVWDTIMHPCCNFNDSSAKLPSKLRHGLVIIYPKVLW